MLIKCKWLVITSLLLQMLSGCSEPAQKSEDNRIEQKYSQLLVYPKKNKIEHFTLKAHNQTEFNENSFVGRWNLLFMGYTNCPDVCPLTLTDLTKIYEKIDPKLRRKLQILFLSVDPGRDDLEHIAKYMDYFNSDFVGITGDLVEIDKLVKVLGGIYSINTDEGEYYSVDHTARIFIVNPRGERYGIISSEAMHNKDKTLLIEELVSMLASDQ